MVGSPKPRTKSKNSPTHPGTEKREAKVVILGDFRGGLRVLNPIVALLGDFGYSQNGGGTFSDFLIFFSPWLYLLITTSSSLKAAD